MFGKLGNGLFVRFIKQTFFLKVAFQILKGPAQHTFPGIFKGLGDHLELAAPLVE